jgi:hypothetical protein
MSVVGAQIQVRAGRRRFDSACFESADEIPKADLAIATTGQLESPTRHTPRPATMSKLDSKSRNRDVAFSLAPPTILAGKSCRIDHRFNGISRIPPFYH